MSPGFVVCQLRSFPWRPGSLPRHVGCARLRKNYPVPRAEIAVIVNCLDALSCPIRYYDDCELIQRQTGRVAVQFPASENGEMPAGRATAPHEPPEGDDAGGSRRPPRAHRCKQTNHRSTAEVGRGSSRRYKFRRRAWWTCLADTRWSPARHANTPRPSQSLRDVPPYALSTNHGTPARIGKAK